MAKFFFSLKLQEAISSISVMKMLVEQAEANISRALIDADKPVELQRFHALTIHAVRALAMMKMKLGLNTNI